MSDFEFSPCPSFSPEVARVAGQILESGKVNYRTGGKGRAFEAAFAEFADVDHAIAVANGSVALDTIWKALKIGPGDEVITTSRTFIASASSIVLAGGTPIFADVDRNSQNITAETVAPLITDNTRAILCVHLAGWPCEMDGLIALATKHNLKIVEDAAQAHGATYRGDPVGGLGDIAAWSFCQDKIITTAGEGGMITTNDEVLWNRAWSFKDHGKDWQKDQDKDFTQGYPLFQDTFGTNGRLTEIQSAIGIIQLEKLSEWTEARTRNANRIRSRAAQLSALRVPELPNHIKHAWYKLDLFVKLEKLKDGWDRDKIVAEIRAMDGAPCTGGLCSEIYLEKCFIDADLHPSGRLPVARELGETCINFAVHPTLDDSQIDHLCDIIDDVMAKASR